MASVIEQLSPPIGPRDAGMTMTLDEFERAEYVRGYRYELIHGVLVVNPPPLEEERDSNEELGRWLRNYQEFHPQGKSLDLTLPEQNLRTIGQNRRPDRVMWVGLGRRPITRGPASKRDVPTIVVEFTSNRPADQRRDYVEKKNEYRDIGVQEYWIVDRFRRTMTVYRWRGQRWTKKTLKQSETYTTALLPGFELPLTKLLGMADKYRTDSALPRRSMTPTSTHAVARPASPCRLLRSPYLYAFYWKPAMASVIEQLSPPIGPRDAGMTMTLDEFERAAYVKGYRYELIHGVLVVNPPPLEEERDSNEQLGHWLRAYQESHSEGKSLDLTLPEQNLRTIGQNRRPDRVMWAGLGRRPITRGPASKRDVPTIVVEFTSVRPADQRRDYEEKKNEYRDIGVQEYWIVDRFRRTMTVYRWRGQRWTKKTFKQSDTYTTALLPGFELQLSKLLAVADKYRN